LYHNNKHTLIITKHELIFGLIQGFWWASKLWTRARAKKKTEKLIKKTEL
jgi:hypothetical protein